MTAQELKQTVEYLVDKANELNDKNKQLEQKARAFDIIKEKMVDITAIMQLETADDYNTIVIFKNGRKCENLFLTEEEFNFLKEMLENE